MPGAATALRATVIVSIIAFGLLLDQHVEFWGQLCTDIAVWLIFIAMLLRPC